MLEDRDFKIICRLRNNSRENLTRMSKKTSVPISTLHDKIQRFKGDIITKHTVILDFKKLGYDLRVNMLLRVPHGNLNRIETFLKTSPSVNSLFRVNNGFDFLAEALFRNMIEFKKFTDRLGNLGVDTKKEFFILEDLKREGFLSEEIYLPQGFNELQSENSTVPSR